MTKPHIKPKKQVICNHCGRSFEFKCLLRKHMTVHNSQEKLPRIEGLTCQECDLVFSNRGLLIIHNNKLHNSKSEPSKCKLICGACPKGFYNHMDLKYHIREFHFNLLSHIPYCNFKKVNQVWFEKVLNSNNIVEIKKVGQNTLLMRKLDDNTAMKVGDHVTEVIDLHDIYPVHRKPNVQCEFCLKMYDKVYINKHINDVHLRYNDKEMIKT